MKKIAQIQEWPIHVGTSVEKSRSAYPGSRGSSRIDQMTASGDRDRTDDFEPFGSIVTKMLYARGGRHSRQFRRFGAIRGAPGS